MPDGKSGNIPPFREEDKLGNQVDRVDKDRHSLEQESLEPDGLTNYTKARQEYTAASGGAHLNDEKTAIEHGWDAKELVKNEEAEN